MQWKKLGIIFTPDRNLSWQQSHVQNPFPVQLDEHIFRIFFASRDKDNISRSGYFDLDMQNIYAPKKYCTTPVLDIGELGAFDDCGAMPHCIIQKEDEFILYYTGWTKAVEVPFLFFIGAAKSKSLSGPFVRVSRAPIIGRNFFDPYLTCAPYVLKIEDKYIMYYISGLKWEKNDQNVKHYYTIKAAESSDALNWITNDKIIIELEKEEYALARPVLFFDKGKYELWFSYRGGANTYRIGLAISDDLKKWKREDVDLPLSDEGWDSEMVCYAHPFFYKEKKYLLYNGNDYGASGSGLAMLSK
ncbi:MAG: hypothetical protein V4549_00900 [Bacteroidota bacterium]